jgi:phage terminase large subunit-like protein
MRTDKDLSQEEWDIRLAAESDLATFIRLIAPYNMMGGVHEELCAWWTREDALSHQLTLLPRDHGKSRYIAFRVAWYITRNPDCRILYISSTANLAEKQLGSIKQILTSRKYRKYWPEMIHPEEGKREKWTGSEICVDHPKRKEEGVRDPTVFTAGLTTGITGMHCDVAVLDDIVVQENAYTEEGRRKVHSQFSLLSSIEGADGEEWVVGTRYHPLDLYGEMQKIEEDLYDTAGYVIGSQPVYEVFERKVEDEGDGTGEFIWPRQMRPDGKWFGFNREILARKRAKYLDKTQFYAQYYNDPNSGEEGGISRNHFQYYNKDDLKFTRGRWHHQYNALNVVAAIDLSYSVGKRSDYTSIVVLGVDADRFYYVLEVDRFKTESIREYYKHILELHKKWEFNKLIAETTAAQQAIVRELKQEYLQPNGVRLSIEEVKPTRHQGTKEERLSAVLEPVYTNNAVFHYRGGNCQVLEDELIMQFPPHDDCKDALANAIDKIVPPSNMKSRRDTESRGNVIFHKRFGGVVA